MHLKVFTKCQMLCNAYDDMSGFSILNTRGVTVWCSGGGSAWVGDCSWPSPVIVRGVVPSPAECRKVTLVNCSCHWVTSLVGRFLRCPIVWTRFVKHLLAAEPPSVGRHNGDVACWQAREPREKNWLSLALWYSLSDCFSIHLVIGSLLYTAV